jgi:photosystem II stability/assembly factor-like uncharacterized protein
MKTFLLFLFSVILVSTSNAQWTRTNGPEGVSVSCLANINGIIYAGTQVNGVYISTDDGVSWIARNAGIETYRISSIVSLHGFIFAGTFGSGVYRSSDGGVTWAAPTNGTNFYIVSLVANDPYIFAGEGGSGVYRSSDDGMTWTQKLSSYYIDAMCKNGNKIFASESNYTIVTSDNGETWSNVQSLEGAIIFSYYSEGNNIFAGGQTKIYRSTDSGNSFTAINLNLGFSIVNIFSIISDGSTLFAATSYDGVYKSTDNGSTWVSSNQGMGPKDARALTITNASTLIAGSHYVGMYRSTDNGGSWSKTNNGFPAGISILSLQTIDNDVYAGTRDGVYKTNDNGDSWAKLIGSNDTINYCTVWDMCELDGDIYVSMFLQFNSTVYKTTDKGLTWHRCDNGLPPGNPFIKGLVASGENIVAGTDEGIYYSSDKGTSWHVTNAPAEYIPSLASSGDYVFAVVTFYGIYRSFNNGTSWIPALPSTVNYVDVAALDNYAYAGSFFDGARYSQNNGSTWFTSNGFGTDASIYVIGPVGGGMVLAGTDLSSNWIFISYDYGQNYTPYGQGFTPNSSVEALTANDTYTFAGTDYNGVWRRIIPGLPVELASFTAKVNSNTITLNWQTATETNNFGFDVERRISATNNQQNNWNRIGFVEGNGTTTETHNYSYVDEEINSGNYEYRLKQIDLDGSLEYSQIVDVQVLSLTKFSLSQNYPNPFNPNTTIKFSIPVSGKTSLKVFNILGEKVSTLINEVKEAGNYEINFDASNLPSGTYLYQLRAGNFVETRKMILMK